MLKYFIITYGCQMNKADSERVASVLENIGYSPAPDINRADLIVINACSVRQSAIDRIFGQCKKFAELKTANCKLKTILTGCVLPADRKKFAEKFDLILNIKDLPTLPEQLKLLKQLSKINNPRASSINNAIQHIYRDRDKYVKLLDGKNYLNIRPKNKFSFSYCVPIMTGCDNFCTYCAVPHTRGREISRPAEEIICEAERAAQSGAKEIWLLGQNVNSYNSRISTNLPRISRIKNKKIGDIGGKFAQIGDMNFPKLLRMVNDIPGKFWIRFTSPHPKDFSDELIEAMAKCKKVTPYLNLPVQSGDNTILKKMNRPYTVERYKNLVKKIRKNIPDIALSTDVIVGFPGETKKQFENTAKLFKEIKFDMAYISQFSPRPGTAAARMKDNVTHDEKEKRWKILTDILRETAAQNNKKYIGKTVTVLVENEKKRCLIGKSEHYKTVKFSGKRNLVGQFTRVKIVDTLPWGLKANCLALSGNSRRTMCRNEVKAR